MSSGLGGGDSKRNIEAIALLALILTMSTFSIYSLVTRTVACFPGDIGTAKCPLIGASHDFTSLGVWKNFPSDACCLDQNELMFNTSYRGLIVTKTGGSGGITVGMEVSCITPSNTVGAALQLQYANFSAATNTNTSNFVNLAGIGLNVDGGTNRACPGNIISGASIPLPAINLNTVVFIFRVMGAGGGGVGDNPRFSSIRLFVERNTQRVFSIQINTITTTTFNWNIFASYPVALSTLNTFNWIATNNGVAVQSGSATCTIAVGASACGAQTVTFGAAFVGVPNVVGSISTPAGTVNSPVGTLDLLTAQTVTV